MNKVSIVVPVLNNLSFTKHCIESVKEHTDVDYELIVVDNGSRERTATWLAECPHIDKLIRNEQNIGFGEAVNQGWAQSEGYYVATINNDTVAGPGWLSGLIDRLESDSRIGITGKYGGFCRPDWTCAGIEQHWAREVDYIEGSCLLMRRETYKQLGGFSRAYSPAYCEDTDLSIRAHRKNMRVVCEPNIEFEHVGGQTSSHELSDRMRELLVRNHYTLRQLYGQCDTVRRTWFPVTIWYYGTNKPSSFGYVDPADPFGLFTKVHFESVKNGLSFGLADADTEWVLQLKPGEKISHRMLMDLPDMLTPARDAWVLNTPSGREVRLFRKSHVQYDPKEQRVVNTDSNQAGDYKAEAIINA